MTKKRGVLKAVNGFIEITVNVNGADTALRVKAGEYLLDALRRHGFKGAKKGCDTGDCGSCTILLDGKPALSCLLFAAQAHGRKVTTIEGLGNPRRPHPIQQAFVEAGAVQCGYCIPGMILSAKALLDENPDPGEAEVRRALDGNLCRCTGYVKQVEAVLLAAKKLKQA
ncbi:MAG: (2Fe-2S)-binding protein [Elusimicrobia bacterium]|nr:(2Fe-2S)-binding protein [Elusimicrobiota bacterium]